MKIRHFQVYQPICPNCMLQRVGSFLLQLQIRKQSKDIFDEDIVEEGQLFCSHCHMIYPILLGIPIIVADPARFIQQNMTHLLWPTQQSFFFQQWIGEHAGPTSSFEISRQYLSTYGWSHFHDLDTEDQEEGMAPSNLPQIAEHISLLSSKQFPLDEARTPLETEDALGSIKIVDVGSSVGRLSIEMLQRYFRADQEAIVLGVDMNFSMVALAQKAIREGKIEYAKRKIGMTYEWRSFDIHFEHAKYVDYWVADALCLPFENRTIDHSICCNILDCVADPFMLLQELERIQAENGMVSLICPYDWSGNINESDKWIGGVQQMGALQGDVEATLHWILSQTSPIETLRQCHIVKETAHIPWRIRLHQRSQMHYSVHHIDFLSNRA